jgi:hypothetical protein
VFAVLAAAALFSRSGCTRTCRSIIAPQRRQVICGSASA